MLKFDVALRIKKKVSVGSWDATLDLHVQWNLRGQVSEYYFNDDDYDKNDNRYRVSQKKRSLKSIFFHEIGTSLSDLKIAELDNTSHGC